MASPAARELAAAFHPTAGVDDLLGIDETTPLDHIVEAFDQFNFELHEPAGWKLQHLN